MSAEVSYEDSGQHASLVLMSSGGEFHDGNYSHWADQKNPSFTRSTYSYNTNWETAAMYISVAEEATRKETGRVNYPLECWGFNNSTR